MKISFTITGEIEVDPDDWRGIECFEHLIAQLVGAALDDIKDPVIVIDAGDAAQLWALVRPEGRSVDDADLYGDVEELDQCHICNRPIQAGETFITVRGGGTWLCHHDCISDGTIDSRTGKFTANAVKVVTS